MMIFLFRQLVLIALMTFSKIWGDECQLKNPSIYLPDEVWEMAQGYLIPDDHPVKNKLDQIFSHFRVIADFESMKASGFYPVIPQKCTKIVVSRHAKLSGYVIKTYLDILSPPSQRMSHLGYINRIKGSRLIRESIKNHHFEHLLKVPEKWLYLLPDPLFFSTDVLKEYFILVEEDMSIFNEKKNQKLWKSKWVTEELLDAIYTVTTEHCLSDSAVPRNCPFSKDKRVAFVDTQRFNTGLMKYDKLTPFLSYPMKKYWKTLIKNGVAK